MTSNNNLNVEKIKAEVSKNVPELRFQGFIDAWELRKLKEVTERVRGNDGRMDLPTLTISAGSGWLDQRERFSNNIAGKEQKNYTLLHKGELSYNHGNSKLAKYGAVFELTTYEEALVPRVYHSFKTNGKSSSCFIEYMFATKRPDRELGKLVSSGARMDGLLNINFDEFMGINIILPSTNEQNKISEFLRKLDLTITLHQRKLDKLKRLKQGYLQQLFPKNDEKVPRVRFAYFENKWEQRKLGDLLTKNSKKNKDLNVTNVESVSNKTGFTKQTEQFEDYSVASADLSNYYVITEKQFAYNPSRINVGSIAYKAVGDDKSVVSPLYVSFSTKKLLNDGYLWNWFKTTSFQSQRERLSEGGVRDTLSFNQLSEMSINVPEYLEQEKIGSFFKQMDDAIALYQSKLDKLKSIKQSLLQKMFI
ncbi:restriction endonuclease subunit S [Lactococcus lactis]|uniref:Restriction endonuclease subunit S n=1 Tax=Lactococcus lactis TaxID=1358 RepID=A0A9X4S563_9LACT|nr:restriction endonuclease subunit S [Lactococcus lactis]MDG4984785.1 restriction endonuclease subunit S [Lactococcus lactis]